MKYGESKNFYNSGSSSLAKRVAEKTGCEVLLDRDSGNARWWPTANPKFWSYADVKIGEEQICTLYNENGNRRRVFQNFLDAKVGDVVIGYEANPVKKIVAIARVTQANDGKAIYFEKVEDLQTPIEYLAIKECPELEKMEFFIQPNGSLFKSTKGEYDFIMGYRPYGADFKLTDGIFYRFCQTAENYPDKEFFFIIDEINRGNMSKIFGELLMLIEKNYRGMKVTLAIFDFRSFLNPAMLLAESPTAKSLRQLMFDIVIDFINQKAGGAAKYINQRDSDNRFRAGYKSQPFSFSCSSI